MIAAASATGTKRVTVGLMHARVRLIYGVAVALSRRAPARFGVAVTRLGSADVRGGPDPLTGYPQKRRVGLYNVLQ